MLISARLKWAACLGLLLVVIFSVSFTVAYSGLLDFDTADDRFASRQFVGGGGADSLDSEYDLRSLSLLEVTIFYLEEAYLDPSSFDYDLMLRHALDTVESVVPDLLIYRKKGGTILHIEVGGVRESFDVEPVTGFEMLYDELLLVATVLDRHVDPAKIIGVRDGEQPLAQIEYAIVNGLLSTLDPHSVLLPPFEGNDFATENDGSFGGLGVTLVNRRGHLIIDSVVRDTPAERAGLQAGDHIAKIDGVSTINIGMDAAIERLRGMVGDPVDLQIERESESEPWDVTIVRAEIKINPVEATLLDGGIGLVEIPGFHRQVEQDLSVHLSRLNRESGGLNGLIIDLRDNPGGYLNQAIAVADKFLWEGDIVSTTVGSYGDGLDTVSSDSRAESKYPLVVLVNAYSASASEIVAGALRNNGRAVVIGERTFGKGSVQNLYSLARGAKLKMTISQYLTPSEKSIQSVGIPADIELLPAVVVSPEGEEEGRAHLFHREWVQRESDLDAHLAQWETEVEQPVFRIRYLDQVDDRDSTEEDFEVDLARELLLASSSWRRADILDGSAAIISRTQASQDAHIVNELAKVGLDWKSGEDAERIDLDLSLDLGPDAVLDAGEETVVTLRIQNHGDEPVPRLSAVVTGGSEFLLHREFHCGWLAAHGSCDATVKVRVDDAYPSESQPLVFSLRSDGQPIRERVEVQFGVNGAVPPRLAMTVQPLEGANSDGDGLVEAGEEVLLSVSIENIGETAATGSEISVRNRSEAAVEIVEGNLIVGAVVKDGETCEDCETTVAPGEHWSGEFVLKIAEGVDLPESVDLDLSLGEAVAYDVAAIDRARLTQYFSNTVYLTIPLGAELPEPQRFVPPSIEVTTNNPLETDRWHTSISGYASDDGGLAQVVIYHHHRERGEMPPDKISFIGATEESGITKLPYTVDVDLVSGLNTIVIVATDHDGLDTTRSVVINSTADSLQAQARE